MLDISSLTFIGSYSIKDIRVLKKVIEFSTIPTAEAIKLEAENIERVLEDHASVLEPICDISSLISLVPIYSKLPLKARITI